MDESGSDAPPVPILARGIEPRAAGGTQRREAVKTIDPWLIARASIVTRIAAARTRHGDDVITARKQTAHVSLDRSDSLVSNVMRMTRDRAADAYGVGMLLRRNGRLLEEDLLDWCVVDLA